MDSVSYGITLKNLPFLDLPPGLGGAMAMTERRVGVGETSLLLRKWKVLLGFEEKLEMEMGEEKREEESFRTLFVVEEEERVVGVVR